MLLKIGVLLDYFSS
uniref:Uncharacterized protein n=1 Tax=Anguilla anguilla TaxID=7936 RepID=A0A0E9XVI5_ANGAN